MMHDLTLFCCLYYAVLKILVFNSIEFLFIVQLHNKNHLMTLDKALLVSLNVLYYRHLQMSKLRPRLHNNIPFCFQSPFSNNFTCSWQRFGNNLRAGNAQNAVVHGSGQYFAV